MKKLLLQTLCVSALLSAGNPLKAQISISSLPYTPAVTDFNAYDPSSASNLAATLPAGWTASSSAAYVYNGHGTGSNSTGGFWSYGSGNDYSLGALRTGTAGDITYGVSFTNNSGSTITSITLSWDYKQWRYANTSGWDVSGTGQLAGNTTLDAKDFTGSAAGSNGTSSTTSIASFTISGLSITSGQSFGIQWVTTDAIGSDNGIAIDNFSITASAATVLPVGLLGFDAHYSGYVHHLNWVTACNSTVHRFDIERNDGSGFTPIGTVDAKHEPCTGNRRYTFDAPWTGEGYSLYRLSMSGDAGEISYSPTVALHHSGAVPELSVAPNPASDVLHVIGGLKGRSWYIANVFGQKVGSGFLNDACNDIRIDHLSNGVYFLHADGMKGVRFIKR